MFTLFTDNPRGYIYLLLLLFLSSTFNDVKADCNDAILLECGFDATFDTRSGTNTYDRTTYTSCYSGTSSFNARNLLFKIDKRDNKVWNISIYNSSSIDLDMFLLDNCYNGGLGRQSNTITCLGKSVNSAGSIFANYNYDVITISTPGVYYIVVDGYNSSQEGSFTINVGCDDFAWDDFIPCYEVGIPLECNASQDGFVGCYCPPPLFCICDSPKMNNYSCLPQEIRGCMTGYESIYSFKAETAGEYTFEVSNLEADLDFFVLADFCYPGFNGVSDYTCLAYSANSGKDSESITLNLSLGQTITLVLDGFLGASGGFQIRVSCPTNKECTADCCSFPSIFSDCYSFEDYQVGNLLPQAGPAFSVNNISTQNAIITNEKARNGTKAVKILASSNINLNINRNIGENAARLEWWMFLPSQKSSLWALKTNNITNGPIIMEVKNGIGQVGAGSLTAPTFTNSFPVRTDTWIKCALIFQPYENEIELWVDGKFVYKEINYQSNTISQLNFYGKAGDQNNQFYIDEICYNEFNSSILCSPNYAPICFNGVEYYNACYALFDGYTGCEKSCNSLNCYDESLIFSEDFDIASSNSYGYTSGDKVNKNTLWWEGASATVSDETAAITENNTLTLKLNHSKLSNYNKVKVSFIDYFEYSTWGIPRVTNVHGELCLMNQNSCIQSIKLNDLVTYLARNPDCPIGGNDLGTCEALFEILIDKQGGVDVYVNTQKLSALPNISGSQITGIQFIGKTSIDNVSVTACNGSINSGTSTLTFDIDDNACAPVGSIVKIPVRVKDFNQVSAFQFSVKIDDPSKAQFESFEKASINGDLNFGLLSPSLATVIWDNISPIDLPDNTVVMYINLKVTSLFSGVSTISIIESPTSISAEQNLTTVIPSVIGGSYCSTASTFNLCGKILREDNVPIPNVTVTLSGAKSATTTSDAGGNYCFGDINANQNYTITPTKTTTPKNGVNSGDVSAIRRHILALEKLNSPYKIIAADASKTKSVNSGDVSEIRRLILSLINEFTNNDSWNFIPKSHTFSNPTNPFASAIPSTIIITNLNADASNLDFVGVKVGDVNLSNTPAGIQNLTHNRTATNIELNIGSATPIGGQNFEISITVKQFNDITSGQFSVNWNTAFASFLSIKDLNTTLNLTTDNFNSTITVDGKLGFIWDSPTPVNLPDNAVLFTLQFLAKGNGTSTVNITSDPVEQYFENSDKESLHIILSNGSITVPTMEYYEDIRIYPNPTTDVLSITSSTHQIHKVRFIDMRGQLVKTVHDPTNAPIHLSELSSGVYTLHVSTDDKTIIRKIILLR
ncbi:MAG: T9SS type A sorting domain-containing protein [Saprospiraceae bacterium]